MKRKYLADFSKSGILLESFGNYRGIIEEKKTSCKMKDLNISVFKKLFGEACHKCFGYPVTSSLSDPDSKLLSNKIFDQTGLIIGAKSIKNYSRFVFSKDDNDNKENPSIATLDTFARYVLDAPATNEIQRKDNESHYPYWFQYKNSFISKTPEFQSPVKWKKITVALIPLLAIIGLYTIYLHTGKNKNDFFYDGFSSVSTDSLLSRGWIIKSPYNGWWNKRDEKAGHLALYTLRGDNWALGNNRASIKNLLMRKITSDCFAAEIRLTGFVPLNNWQQAGILISEDSTFTGKMIRLSIAYNDYFGGYQKPAEIIIQVISSTESGFNSKPQEVAQIPIFTVENTKDSLAIENLSKSILKIEKKGNHFRFLYSASSIESFALKEAANGDFSIQPKYISIFAIQGWAEIENITPVYFDSFSIMKVQCVK